MKKNNNSKIIMYITVFIVVLAAFIIFLKVTEDEKTIFMNKYSSMNTANHVFDTVSLAELDEIIATNEKIFVYFGSPICSACVAMAPIMDQQAKDRGIETVYYVDLEYTSDLAGEWYDNGTYDYKGTPAVVLFEGGVFVKSYQSAEYEGLGNLVVTLEAFLNDYA